MLLTIHHTTLYRYSEPVSLLPHRMMLCPRGTQNLKLVSARFDCVPDAQLDWTQDVFGNLIATARFAAPCDRLEVTAHMVVEQAADAWPIFRIAPHAHSYPFAYSDDERTDLGALLVPEYPDPGGLLAAWARKVVLVEPADTLALLKDVNAAARIDMDYVEREEEGTQAPLETVRLAQGSCRDLSTLFIEAVRHLGFAARAVSGYLYDPPVEGEEANQHGATHAWAEVYLPSAGWVAFDPTNGRMGEGHLVPVSVARNITQIKPIEGSYVGTADLLEEMTVDVTVTQAA